MEWKERSSRYDSLGECGAVFTYYILAGDIIYEAFDEGIINWNIYQKARDKIKSNANGSWMFEHNRGS